MRSRGNSFVDCTARYTQPLNLNIQPLHRLFCIQGTLVTGEVPLSSPSHTQPKNPTPILNTTTTKPKPLYTTSQPDSTHNPTPHQTKCPTPSSPPAPLAATQGATAPACPANQNSHRPPTGSSADDHAHNPAVPDKED